jgi:hypothetical protein
MKVFAQSLKELLSVSLLFRKQWRTRFLLGYLRHTASTQHSQEHVYIGSSERQKILLLE